MFKKLQLLAALLLGLGISPAAYSQEAATSEPSAALRQGLSAIDQTSLSSDLHFLASDAMRGRNTPSPELKLAAMYLRNRVQRLGFEPGAGEDWFYEYPLYTARLDASASSLVAEGASGRVEFAVGSDYFLQRTSHVFDLDIVGGVISVGKGSRRDFDGLDIEGKWVLLAHKGIALSPVVKRAKQAGALGLIATPGADYSREPYPEKYAKALGFMLEGRASISPPRTKQLLPQVMLTEAAAAKLFSAAGRASDALFPPTGSELTLQLHELRRREVTTEEVYNVCAFWPGSDPDLAKEVMVVSAHYDHVGVRKGEVYNGADDNASGTSGVLALADSLRAYGPLKRSVLLMWVSGEEKGLWGSEAWTKAPQLPEGYSPVLNINIDMIGRTQKDELYITPSREHQAFNIVAETAYGLSASEGFPTLESQDEYWERSDHANFNDHLGIPVVFLSSGDHPDYHQPGDTPDKIDYEKLARSVRLVLRLLDALQELPLAQ